VGGGKRTSTSMGVRRRGQGGTCPPLEMLKNLFFCYKCCLKPQKTKYLCIILKKKFRQLLGALPQTPTKELPLVLAGGLPSFRPPNCPPLEKILRATISTLGHVGEGTVDGAVGCRLQSWRHPSYAAIFHQVYTACTKNKY